MHDEGEVIIVEVEEGMAETGWEEGDPRPVTVDVIINDDTGQGDFSMESDPDTDGVPIVQEYILKFNNNQNNVYSNGFAVNVCLPANRGRNADWTFDADPIWAKLVDKHGSCPRNKNDNDPSLFDPTPTLSADKRTLQFGNPNADGCYFGFALRFASTKKGKTLTYDPIGDNQNGSYRA